jgi:hypothetical protein
MKLLWFCLLLAPLLSRAQPATTDTVRLGQHLRYLTSQQPARSAAHPAVLDSVAAYVARHLRAAGGRVARQPVPADGVPTKILLPLSAPKPVRASS